MFLFALSLLIKMPVSAGVLTVIMQTNLKFVVPANLNVDLAWLMKPATLANLTFSYTKGAVKTFAQT